MDVVLLQSGSVNKKKFFVHFPAFACAFPNNSFLFVSLTFRHRIQRNKGVEKSLSMSETSKDDLLIGAPPTDNVNKTSASPFRVTGIDVGVRELGIFSATCTNCLTDMEIREWKVLDLGGHMTIEEQIDKLVECLLSAENKYLLDEDCVTIEKQIGKRAVNMTAFSYCIKSALTAACVALKKKVPEIEYKTSMSKFAFFSRKLNVEYPHKATKQDTAYGRRKKTKMNSIFLTSLLLEKVFLNESKSVESSRLAAKFAMARFGHQDDMADCANLALVKLYERFQEGRVKAKKEKCVTSNRSKRARES